MKGKRGVMRNRCGEMGRGDVMAITCMFAVFIWI